MSSDKTESRSILLEAPSTHAAPTFLEELRQGLSQEKKSLPCRFLYDEQGSILFEEICETKDYYPTAAETQILETHAKDIVAGGASASALEEIGIVELGSGSARKIQLLLGACFELASAAHYVPIDISRGALVDCSDTLRTSFPNLRVTAVEGDYETGLPIARDALDEPRLWLWLGGSIGNMSREDAVEFLRLVGSYMAQADRLVVGIDLRKDKATLERAYDDSDGVTAEFNLNLLRRVNRELGGNFVVDNFQHLAQYDEVEGRVELYLVSSCKQRVNIEQAGLVIDFEAGERIHTEYSHKYSHPEIDRLAEAAGFGVRQRWHDNERRFSLNEFVPLS